MGIAPDHEVQISPAQDADVERAVNCLVDAFANDPQMAYFLPFDNAKRPQIVREFFTILMEARLELGMPVLAASEDGRAIGAVMGYDTTRLKWKPQHARKFVDLEAKHPGLPERFARADHVMAEFRPSLPHHYLGVVGVSSEAQGRGVGRALINSFLSLSERDARSLGTFLETANSRNVPYYEAWGFKFSARGRSDQRRHCGACSRPSNGAGLR